jgi:hypothetical protein
MQSIVETLDDHLCSQLQTLDPHQGFWIDPRRLFRIQILRNRRHWVVIAKKLILNASKSESLRSIEHVADLTVRAQPIKGIARETIHQVIGDLT